MQHIDTTFDNKQSLWPFLKRIFTHSMSYKTWFWTLVGSTVVVAMADAFFPLIWKDYLDTIIVPAWQELEAGHVPSIQWQSMKEYIFTYVAWMLIMAAGVFVFIWATGNIQEHVIYDLRKAMFNKLQTLSFSYFDRSAIGWLISRITSDTDRVAELISWSFISFVWGISMVVFSFAFMFSLDWELTLWILATFPFLLFISIRIRLLILKYSRKARKENSEITASFNEHINGVEVNKTTVQEERVTEDFKKQSERMRMFSFRAAFYTAIYLPLVFTVGAIAAGLVIYFGGVKAVAQIGGISIGTLAAFLGYSRFIFEPIFDISRFYAQAQHSLSAGERIFSLIDEAPEITDKLATGDFSRLHGNIEFEAVSFYYHKDKPILTDFNLTIHAGTSVALVGPTGHGKTTLTALISRFYEPKRGQLKIDGIDYRERKLASFRNQLGVILQTPHLFSGTIRENIAFGTDQPTNEQIVQTLHQIGAHNLVEQLDEEVGEEGMNLSNGQRQLVSFARALLKNPSILIMDEATSSIDTITESIIQKGIQTMTSGRTSIIIAHRLSTIKHCDRIIYIEHGKIMEDGSHETLMQQKGKYYELYMKQARLG